MTDHFPERRFDPPNPVYVSIWFSGAALLALVVFTILILLCLWRWFRRALRNNGIIAPTTTVAELELSAVGLDPYVRQRIPHVIFASTSELPYEEEKCACCQFEFMIGESVSIIPSCRHSFHSSCFF